MLMFPTFLGRFVGQLTKKRCSHVKLFEIAIALVHTLLRCIPSCFDVFLTLFVRVSIRESTSDVESLSLLEIGCCSCCAGPAGQTVRDICKKTSADIKSWTDTASGDSAQPTRMYVIEVHLPLCIAAVQASAWSFELPFPHCASGFQLQRSNSSRQASMTSPSNGRMCCRDALMQ